MAQRSPKQGRRQIQPASGPEKAFGQALREVRQAKKISQERLALEGGFDRTYISLIERGINAPSFEVLEQMSGALRMPVRELFDFRRGQG